MTSSELRRLLLEAGLRVLYRHGLRATANHVPISEAIDELDRTRGLSPAMGSIFGQGRPWRSVKDFQVDLLLTALADESLEGPNDQSLQLVADIEDQRDRPPAERIASLVELCRFAGFLNGYVPEQGKDRNWTIWLAIWTMSMSDTERGEELRAPLLRAQRTSQQAFLDLYSIVLDRLGLRIRPPYTLEQFSMVAASLTDGVGLRAGIDTGVITPVESPRAAGEWNLMGVGLMALALEFVEPNPTLGTADDRAAAR